MAALTTNRDRRGGAAVYFDPESPEDIAGVGARVRRHQRLCAELRWRGVARACKFRRRRVAQKVPDVFRQVAAGERNTRGADGPGADAKAGRRLQRS